MNMNEHEYNICTQKKTASTGQQRMLFCDESCAIKGGDVHLVSSAWAMDSRDKG